MTIADTLSYSVLAAIVVGLVFVTLNYAKGLRGSPRELWLLYGYKFSELMGYKIVALSAVLWLSVDCGMSDKGAGSLYSGYSLFASAMGIVVGALIDTAGIRRVMFASIGLLLFARFSMVWLTMPVLAFIFGLAPMALGFAIVSPLTSVAIKRFTTKAGAAYGFSLFYVLMNLGFTFGNIIYDKATSTFGLKDANGKNIDQSHGIVLAGHHFSTYQILFSVACCATLVSLCLTLPMRDGVERDEDGIKITPVNRPKFTFAILSKFLRNLGFEFTIAIGRRYFWSTVCIAVLTIFGSNIAGFFGWNISDSIALLFEKAGETTNIFLQLGYSEIIELLRWFTSPSELGRIGQTVLLSLVITSMPLWVVMMQKGTVPYQTKEMIKSVGKERFFWAFLGMIGILMFVKSVFIQWDLVLPKYCPRVMGEGAKVGAINNVNTILILFFVPLVTMTTARVKSYTLMIVGSAISTLACIITAIPENVFAPLTNTTLGEMVFINWLGLAENSADLAAHPPSPFYWSLIFSFFIFTIGEAIWSPRFYQFTAEIAPKGKEATYLSLAVLPTFASKLFVGPMSGWLLETYVPVDANNKPLDHPHHHMVWVWIGLSAAITPVGMLLYRKFFERETEKIGEHLADA